MRQFISLKFILLTTLLSLSLATDNDTINLQPVATTMSLMNFEAKDVAVAPDGTMMAIGLDGKPYKYNGRHGSFDLVAGDIELPKLYRIVLDDDATPYVVSECGGQAFYLDCMNNWVALPGCVKDLGAGKHGEIWSIGCDERVGGFGVWRLFCDSQCKFGSGTKYCTRQRPLGYPSKTKEASRHCYWYRVEGGGLRIDVDTRGNPLVVADNNMVYHYDGVNWKSIPGFKATDVAVSTEGVIFAAGLDKKNTGRLSNTELGTWQILSAPSQHVAVGPFSHFFTICPAGKLHCSANRDLY